MEARLLLLLLPLLAAALLVDGTPCPPDWRQRGATCYLVNATSQLSWAGATALCQETGGVLVSITNTTKLMDVIDVLRGQSSAEQPPQAAPVRRSGRARSPPSRLVISPSQSSYDSISVHVSGPSAETDPGTAAPAPPALSGTDQLGWWINIQKTTGSVLTDRDGGFDNYGEEKIDAYADEINQCVYISADDGLWYWKPCHEKLSYVCERPADRVDIELVTPDRRRPEAAWFAAHAARLEAAFAARQQNASETEAKGTFSPQKVTMTPIPPPSPTTPVTEPPPSPPGPPDAGVSTSTVSPCAGQNWLPVSGRCHHLFLQPKTWQKAQEFCQYQGGTLSAFDSQADQDVFTQRYGFNTGLIWINYRRHNGFSWSSTSGYFAWDQGQPGNGNGDCAAMALHTGKWSANDCAVPRSFACVRDLGVTAPPSTVSPPPTSQPSMPYPECGEGSWWRFGTSCLQLVSDRNSSWHSAQQDCRDRGAMLVKIDNYQKKAFVLNKLSNVSQVWIGLSKWGTRDGQYRWSDGSGLLHQFWAGSHRPNPEMASCTRMDGDHGYWTAANCNLPQPYVCERPLAGQPVWPPAPRPPLRSTCPEQWRPYGADRCLRLYRQLSSWQYARQQCRSEGEGADLLTVPSAVHQAFLTTALRESVHNVWLGLTYQKQGDQQFVTWLDEAPVNYTSWNAGQPTVPCPSCPETCGVVEGGLSARPGAWSNVDCGNVFSFVCQRPATPNNTIEIQLNSCDAPYEEYTSAGDACYKVIHDEMTWTDAAAACQREGSSLAYVGDAFDNAQLVQLLYRDGRQQYWLGLSDAKRYGKMEWTLPWPQEPTVQLWDQTPGQAPVNTSCAVLQPGSGLWRRQACTERRPFVCMSAPDRAAAALSNAGCPADGRWVGSDTLCYLLYQGSQNARTWTDAMERCESQGYSLAEVSNMQDFLAVREALRGLTDNTRVWIGLRYQGPSQGYTWTDGSAANFSGWHNRQPAANDCAAAHSTLGGHWTSVECSVAQPFICMREKAATAAGAGAISGGAGGGSSGWTAFGVICLVVVLAAAVVGGGVWYARRRRLPWLPRWAAGAPSQHHSVDNLAYNHHNDSLAPNRMEGGSLENGDVDQHAAQRWGSQEQLVMDEDL